MSTFAISVILVLMVIFIIILVDALIKNRLSYIVTRCEKDNSCIEAEIRMLIKKHPDSEIIVINHSGEKDILEILEKLSCDFPQLHILY